MTSHETSPCLLPEKEIGLVGPVGVAGPIKAEGLEGFRLFHSRRPFLSGILVVISITPPIELPG